MSVEQVLARNGPRKLLALDGGGVRGAISIQILKRIESLLREELGNPSLVLANYFDYIGGTSIGAVIAAGLALGKTVDDLQSMFVTSMREIFSPTNVVHWWRNRFTADKLTERLQQFIGGTRQLGSAELKTLLLVVLRNATTDSPWPISNNPSALFNARSHAGCNLDFPLWKLVRASTAAPTFFPPEVIAVEGRDIVFVDGGITTFNNPAFQLFLMATATPYRLCWPTGEEELLLVSVGTGQATAANANLRPKDMNLLFNVRSIPAALIAASQSQQDFLCRLFGRCIAGSVIDSEVGDMLDGAELGNLTSRIPSFRSKNGPSPKFFTYVRYNADLSRAGLDSLGLQNVEPSKIWRLDRPANIPMLELIGQRIAARDVHRELFAKFRTVHDVA